ncbi:hypothetical protein ACJX0J_025994, partial [Zea mays]
KVRNCFYKKNISIVFYKPYLLFSMIDMFSTRMIDMLGTKTMGLNLINMRIESDEVIWGVHRNVELAELAIRNEGGLWEELHNFHKLSSLLEGHELNFC